MQPCLVTRPGGCNASYPARRSVLPSTTPAVRNLINGHRTSTSRESALDASAPSCSSSSSGFDWLRPSVPLHGLRPRRHRGDSTASVTQLKAANTFSLESLEQMPETQRHVLADEWGYTAFGQLLPDCARLELLARGIPDELKQANPLVALQRALAPVALMAAGYFWMWYMHSIIPLWQLALCWVMVGTGYAGLFTLAHDAARNALLPSEPDIQDFIGTALMAPSLYSFASWKLRFISHAVFPNMLGEDDSSWQPLTKTQLAGMSEFQRSVARLLTTTPLKLLGSLGHWAASWGRFDLKPYQQMTRMSILMSWAVPFWFVGIAFPLMILAGGISGLVNWWLMPFLVFHVWLSVLTLVQHTAPHIPFRPPGPEYDAGQAAVSGTVTATMPRWLELVLNDANYHLPQHLAPSVPCYHARAATEALREKLGPYMTEAQLSLKLLANIITCWQVYDTAKHTYITFDEALSEIQAESSQKAAAA